MEETGHLRDPVDRLATPAGRARSGPNQDRQMLRIRRQVRQESPSSVPGITVKCRRNRRQMRQDFAIVMVATMIGRVPGFEIAGYDQAFLDEFSSRRREILEHLDRLGLPRTSRAASLAALVTRRRKSDRNLDDLRREWRGRAARLV